MKRCNILTKAYFFEGREINDDRVERDKEVEEKRRPKSGVYDLKSFAGIPYQSPDCERDRVYSTKNFML